jgi:hypothetical protein
MRKVTQQAYEENLETAIRWDVVERDIQHSREDDPEDSDQEIGYSYLGSIFSITPSCKMYTPWANSNVERCPSCNGTGSVWPKASKRQIRKWKSRANRAMSKRRSKRKAFWVAPARTCKACYGCGSLEAANDESWRDALEAVAYRHGYFVTNNEDDGILLAKCFQKDIE